PHAGRPAWRIEPPRVADISCPSNIIVTLPDPVGYRRETLPYQPGIIKQRNVPSSTSMGNDQTVLLSDASAQEEVVANLPS
ncbi:MAG: hypothetical protein VX453_10905, partial [Acidobacteriota bacterium]|nr:hypothetical protein [Acidobacteriota bacterium]